MKILVTGGAGYIGSHTCVELLNQDYDICIVDNFCNSSPIVLDRIKDITKKDFQFYNVDIIDLLIRFFRRINLTPLYISPDSKR